MAKSYHKSVDKIQINTHDFVRYVVERLHNLDFEAYIVGGAIRDVHLQRPVTDWDVVTSASPKEVETIFKDTRNFSLKHETVTLVHEGHHYDVTSFKGTVRSNPKIEDDLGHRDFTINAMAYDLRSEEVLDPFGGREDISLKVIRAVGNPEIRFMEDPLRLLRGVRIGVELNFKIEKKTMDTISRLADQLSSIAPERIRDELIKILLCSKPSRGISVLRRSGLIKHVIPELLEGYLMRQNYYHKYTVFRHTMETLDRVKPDLDMRLAALFHDIGKPRVRHKMEDGFHFYSHEEISALMSERIMERLRFSKDIIKKVSSLVSLHQIYYDKNWSDGAIRRLIRKAGKNNIIDLISLREADLIAHGIENNKLALMEELKQRVEESLRGDLVNGPEGLAIGGERVMEVLGIEQGPRVGQILNKLVEKVTDQPELNTFEQLSKLVRKMEHGG